VREKIELEPARKGFDRAFGAGHFQPDPAGFCERQVAALPRHQCFKRGLDADRFGKAGVLMA
jgi:hypothetical protein